MDAPTGAPVGSALRQKKAGPERRLVKRRSRGGKAEGEAASAAQTALASVRPPPGLGGATIAAESDPRLFIESLEKGLRILSLFDATRPALTVSEIGRISGLGRSAAQRFVYTLERLGYLRKRPRSHEYLLTTRVLDLASAYFGTDPVVSKSAELLGGLNERSGEVVALVELDDTDIVIVSRLAGRHPFSLGVVPGMRFPAYCTAAGRAILAHMPAEEAAAVLARSDRRAFTNRTLTEPEALMEELTLVRRQGHAIVEGETVADAMTVAVPIFDSTKRPVASIYVYCPLARWSRKTVKRTLLPELIRTGEEFSRAIGGAHARINAP
jgi:IclR family transcriptional regulator, pca regulon regulatory protein